MYYLIIIAVLNLSLSPIACANDNLNSGPGLFSGKSGEFSLIKLNNDKENIGKDKIQDASATYNKSQEKIGVESSINLKRQAIIEFDLFKEWKMAKKGNTEGYQEFLLWLEFINIKAVTP